MLVFQFKLFATLARGNAASFYQSHAIKGTQNIQVQFKKFQLC